MNEPLLPDAEDILSYELWISEGGHEKLQEWMYQRWRKFRDHKTTSDGLHFLEKTMSSGFIFYTTGTPRMNAHINYLFLHLKNQTRDLGYILNVNDSRTYLRADQTMRVKRYYLKPNWRENENPNIQNQRFGNVLIELHEKGDELQYLKFQVNIYNDHNFTTAIPFSDLMEELLRS